MYYNPNKYKPNVFNPDYRGTLNTKPVRIEMDTLNLNRVLTLDGVDELRRCIRKYHQAIQCCGLDSRNIIRITIEQRAEVALRADINEILGNPKYAIALPVTDREIAAVSGLLASLRGKIP